MGVLTTLTQFCRSLEVDWQIMNCSQRHWWDRSDETKTKWSPPFKQESSTPTRRPAEWTEQRISLNAASVWTQSSLHVCLSAKSNKCHDTYKYKEQICKCMVEGKGVRWIIDTGERTRWQTELQRERERDIHCPCRERVHRRALERARYTIERKGRRAGEVL